MFRQLTILKSILVKTKYHHHLDMVKILIVYYISLLILLLLLLVGVQSTENMETNKNPSNYGDSETPTTVHVHSVSIGGTVTNIMKYCI